MQHSGYFFIPFLFSIFNTALKLTAFPYIMQKVSNISIEGKHHKPIIADLFYMETFQPKPVIVFSHGFKGFKDWGHFNLIARQFANAGFFFVKFNFSHNGIGPNQSTNFNDLSAFGYNNFIKELDDLKTVIDWLHEHNEWHKEMILDKFYLLGHSRGGSISIIKAAEDSRVKKLVTWAAVADFEKRVNEGDVEKWKKEGVRYVINSRTNQKMPLYYQFRENFYANKERLTIATAVKKLSIPYLIIHGTADEAVPFEEALQLKEWQPKAKLKKISGADHTFGGKHPFQEKELPSHTGKLMQQSIEFFKK